MAALDFPNAPTVGQPYSASNGAVYTWDGIAWVTAGGPTSIGPTTPTNPQPGQLWWRNDPDGNLYISYNDGNSTQWVPAVPSSAPQWAVSGSTLTPVDATKSVAVPGDATSGAVVTGGRRTAKGRIVSHPSNDAVHFCFNRTVVDPADDATLPTWSAVMGGGGADSFRVLRSAAGASPLSASAVLLTLDNAGQLTLPTNGANNAVIFGSRTVKNRLVGTATADTVYLTINAARTPADTWTQDDAAKASWLLLSSADPAGQFLILRMAPGGAASPVTLLTLDNAGNLTITGATATKASGTTWSNPSDIRLKRDIAPYAHGLADILQLEPISYTLKATDQQTCGLDAEKVRAVFPECVGTTRMKLQPEDEEDTEVLTLDIHPILIALINANKELATRVAALEAR
jgi:hypothetical protein